MLNLGSHFDLPQLHWASLAQRIEELVHGQQSMLEANLPEDVQVFAQRFASQIIAHKRCVPSLDTAPSAPAEAVAVELGAATPAGTCAPVSKTGAALRYQQVDLDTIEFVGPRSVGVEHAALLAMRQCGFEDKLAQLGLNRPQIAAAVGNIVARMAHPCSELATHAWLKNTSALGELIDHDFAAMDLNRL